MNFSDILSYSDQTEFSPNSQYIAIVKGLRVTVYESARISPVNSWTIVDHVSKLIWSQDSCLLLCSQNKRGLIQVFNLKDTKWECKISSGPGGLSGSWMTPDARHIVTVCKHKLRLNIWSLLQKEVLTVSNPKFSTKGVIFSKCGQFTGVLRRVCNKDQVAIFDSNYQQVSNFILKTENTDEVFWSNDNYYIIAYDSELLTVYYPTGELVYELDPRPRHFLTAHSSINGCYLALAQSTNKIFILHSITWNKIMELSALDEVDSKSAMVYREEEAYKDEILTCSYEVYEGLLSLGKIEGERKVGLIKWSANERYVACRFDAYPQTVFIWDVVSLVLKSVLVHKKSVKSVEWCPVKSICVITTGNGRIYLWSEEGALLCDLPFGINYLEKDFSVNGVSWSVDGQYFLAKDKGELVVGYPNLEEITQ